MEEVKKNKYSRDERLRQGSQSIIPRPIPRPVKPYNSYSSYFQVQHVAPGFGVNPGKRFVMISGENIRADFAGKVKLPDGSTVRFESVDQLEIDEKIRFIVIRLDPKKETLEALAVEDCKKIPKRMLQRVLAVVDRDRVKQIHHGGDTVDFSVEEEPFTGF